MLVYSFDKTIFVNPLNIMRMDTQLKTALGQGVPRYGGAAEVDALLVDMHKNHTPILKQLRKTGAKISSYVVGRSNRLNTQGALAWTYKPQFAVFSAPYSLSIHEHRTQNPPKVWLELQYSSPRGTKILARSS